MTRDEFVAKIDEKAKLIRTEKGFTQDKMAEILGISKKTLVQVEKGRTSLGWTAAIAICTIFRDSEILQLTFGGEREAEEIILSIAFTNYERDYEQTLGGKFWWKDINRVNNHKVQQNLVTNHYRILDKEDRRICSSFDYEFIEKRLKELI